MPLVLWFCNQQDSFTNMITDGSAWCLMCQFRLKNLNVTLFTTHHCLCDEINLRILLPADNGSVIYSRHRRPSLF